VFGAASSMTRTFSTDMERYFSRRRFIAPTKSTSSTAAR